MMQVALTVEGIQAKMYVIIMVFAGAPIPFPSASHLALTLPKVPEAQPLRAHLLSLVHSERQERDPSNDAVSPKGR